MLADSNATPLSYQRRFMPALAWSVRGAVFQFGGRISIVDDDGKSVFDAQVGTGFIFVALLLGFAATVVLVGSIVMAVFYPTWVSRNFQVAPSIAGALCIFAAIGFYVIALSSMEISLIDNERTAGRVARGKNALNIPVWHVFDEAGQSVGVIQSDAGGRSVLNAQDQLVLSVSANFIPGVAQAAWRSISTWRQSGSAIDPPGGRLRVGMGAGARLELDDGDCKIDRRLLAALLLTVAVQGK